MFVDGVEIKKIKAKNCEIHTFPLCLGENSKDSSVDIIPKRLDYTDMSISFQFIMMVLELIIFWIFINI